MTYYCTFIGLNYTGRPYSLGSCDKDADDYAAMYSALTDNILVLKQLTKAQLAEVLVDLNTKVKDGDKLVFSFSGHGMQKKCFGGGEADNLDECLVLDDGTLSDNELSVMMAPLYAKKVNIVWYMDACHSGTILDFSFQVSGNVPKITRTADIQANNIVANVLCISACADHQTDGDGIYNGALTANIKMFYGTEPDRSLENMIKRISIPGQRMNYSMPKPLMLKSMPFECDLIGSRATINTFAVRDGQPKERKINRGGCCVS